MIHLDTSFLIRALARGLPEDRRLHGWLRSQVGDEFHQLGRIPVWAGRGGASRLARRIIADPIAFLGTDAALTARLFNQTGRRRGSLTDCMIAATAMRIGAPLATANPEDFRRFEAAGLQIVAT